MIKSSLYSISLLIAFLSLAACNRNTEDSGESQKKPQGVTEIQKLKPAPSEPEIPTEAEMYLHIKTEYDEVGSWTIKNKYSSLSYELEVYRDNEQYFAIEKLDSIQVQKLIRKGSKFYVEDSEYGEYYTIDEHNKLELFDDDGPLKKAGYTTELN